MISKLTYRIIITLVLALTGIFVFWNYTFGAGIGVSDDMVYLAVQNESFGSLVSRNLQRLGHVSRPLYAVIQVICLKLFGNNSSYYHLLKICIWCTTIWNISRFARKTISESSSFIILILGLFPFFITGLFQSSFQIGYLIAALFWSFSLIASSKGHFKSESAFILLSLLSCEIVFPLFILNFYANPIKSKKKSIAFFTPLLIYGIFRFGLTPLYQDFEGTYAFNLNLNSPLKYLEFIYTIIISVPTLLIRSISRIELQHLLLIPILGIFFLQKIEYKYSRVFLKASLIGLLISGLIFVVSGYPAQTYGHYNKMLLPVFILIIITLSHIPISKWRGTLAILTILWIISFKTQLDHFVKATEIRKTVISDLQKRLDLMELNDEIILVMAPYFLKDNYNNEHVFWLKWDFEYSLENVKNLSFPFSRRSLSNPEYIPYHNVNQLLNQKNNTSEALFFEYDQKSLKDFKRFKSINEFREFVPMLLEKEPEELIPEERWKEYLKKKVSVTLERQPS
ncbi:MAG: hypothetical protein MRY83_00750 [Flavobacteriales bacterium]|nr:hypothetical protein [Flavobacteriales bacterium]